MDPQIASKDWRDPQMGCFKQKTPDCTKEERLIRCDSNPHLYEFGSAPSSKMVQGGVGLFDVTWPPMIDQCSSQSTYSSSFHLDKTVFIIIIRLCKMLYSSFFAVIVQ